MGLVTLDNIRIALQQRAMDTVAGRATFVPDNQTFDESTALIMYRVFIGYGSTRGIELGGKDSLSERIGVCKVTFSVLAGQTLGQMRQLCDETERAFRREVLPAGGCKVVCQEPYTNTIGTAPDKRYMAEVNVPWATLYNH